MGPTTSGGCGMKRGGWGGMSAIAAVIAGWVVAGVIIETWSGLAVLTGVSGVFLLLTAGAVWLWRHIGRLEELTCTDELTGACNFRHLRRVLPREVARAEREGGPLSLLMLDLRDFKGYNDRHGHLAGNRALAAVVRIILSEVRTGDTVARFGGDEFAVVLPGADEEEAMRIGERVAGRIAGRFGDLEADLGVHGYAGGGPEELLHAADMAMYAGKRSG